MRTIHSTRQIGETATSAPAGRFGIAVSRFNREITQCLLDGARQALANAGVPEEQVAVVEVPGAFELPLAARWLVRGGRCNGVVCLGCVIRGDTDHYDHICRAAADGIARVGLEDGVPVTFGVLTAHTREQAEARAGGALGNLGADSARTLLTMVAIRQTIQTGAGN